MNKEDRLSFSLAVSAGVHVLLFLIMSLTWKEPLVLVPRSVTVRFANVNEVPVEQFVPSQPVKKFNLREFVQDTVRKEPQVRREQRQKEPVKTREQVVQEHREALERKLAEMEDSQESVQRTSSDESLLDSSDAAVAETFPAEGVIPKPRASSSGRMVLSDMDRVIEYEPPKPEYPDWAREARIQGTAIVRVWFDADGFAVGSEINQSTGNAQLDALARNHALKFRLSPTALQEETSGLYTIRFLLD